jgi:calcineurin-like phosphoesterase family protein
MKPNWLYSDPHFYHKNIIKFCNRDYETVSAMNDDLIYRYNDFVDSEDTVVFLGDIAFCSVEWEKHIIEGLNGKKILVRGNHDGSMARCEKLGFDLVVDELVFTHDSIRYRCSHFPYTHDKKWEHPDKFKSLRPVRKDGEILLCGHVHSPLKQLDSYTIHCGVDAWDMSPASFEEVHKLAKKMKKEGK